jgi:predicted GNAT family acetyltransferase
MQHILDNPIWHALHSSNARLCYGNEDAVFIKRDVGFFAGLKNNSAEDLTALSVLLATGDLVVIFSPDSLQVPSAWKIKLNKPLLQMIYPGGPVTENDCPVLTPLQDKDIPAMLALTHLTNPGPFLQRSIDFGNYEGVFVDDRLVAMTGQRLQPDPYTEVSAVCTHPDYLGKGYAARLVSSQINKILSANRVPFLHVYPDNTGALKLYEKLGFETRKEMTVYVLEKIF